mmetsp:Transcript_21725/g.39415  ORF Transcript_21725/g.39415 Transcript_21725/m.39415 type:complete len:102 (+) Transcript_21725:410-715(+)
MNESYTIESSELAKKWVIANDEQNQDVFCGQRMHFQSRSNMWDMETANARVSTMEIGACLAHPNDEVLLVVCLPTYYLKKGGRQEPPRSTLAAMKVPAIAM